MVSIGLERVSNRLKDCMGCGLCTGPGPLTPFREGGVIPENANLSSRCPSHIGFKFMSYSPKGRLWLCAAVYYRDFQISDDLVKIAYTCTTCGLCDELCYLRKMPIFRALREEILKCGVAPPKGVKKTDDNITRTNNCFGGRHDDRMRWARGLDLPTKGDILYFAGCYASYKYPDVARASVSVLREAGCDVAYLAEEEICCGNHLLLDGQVETAMSRIGPLIEAINRSGAKTVIFSCANCYRAFDEYIKAIGPVPFEIAHVSGFFAKLINEGKLKLKPNGARKVTYHDPCSLGRQMNVYNEPRAVVKSIPGVELLEMGSSHRWSACCGSGSSVTWDVYPDYSQWIAARRLKEAKDVADVLVTTCPQCVENFEAAAKKERIDIKIYDLPVLVSEAMEVKTW